MSCLRDHLICMELWPSDKHRLAYTTSLLLFQYCLPLLLVLLCYLRIFLRLKRRRCFHVFCASLQTWFLVFCLRFWTVLLCCAGTCWSAAGGLGVPRGSTSCCWPSSSPSLCAGCRWTSSTRCLTGTTKPCPTASTMPSSPPATSQRWPPPALTPWCTASSTATSRGSWSRRCSAASVETGRRRATRASRSPLWAARAWRRPPPSTGWDRCAFPHPDLRSARQYQRKRYRLTPNYEHYKLSPEWLEGKRLVIGWQLSESSESNTTSNLLHFHNFGPEWNSFPPAGCSGAGEDVGGGWLM